VTSAGATRIAWRPRTEERHERLQQSTPPARAVAPSHPTTDVGELGGAVPAVAPSAGVRLRVQAVTEPPCARVPCHSEGDCFGLGGQVDKLCKVQWADYREDQRDYTSQPLMDYPTYVAHVQAGTLPDVP